MKSPARMKRSLLALALAGLLSGMVTLGACAPGFAPRFASQQRMLLPDAPTETLEPTVLDPTPEQDPIYNIYKLVSARFAANPSKREITARIELKSQQGVETVEMLGKIRDDGSASLLDIQPLVGNQYRVVAEAYCQDLPECKQIILKVFYKVGPRLLEKQFVSQAFAKAVGSTTPAPARPDEKRNEKRSEPHDLPAPTQDQKSGPQLNTKSVPQPETKPETPSERPMNANAAPPPVAPPPVTPAPSDIKDEANLPSLEIGSNDADEGMSTLDDDGEYVGAQPPQDVIDRLWTRPEIPTPPAELPKVASPSESPGTRGTSEPTQPGLPSKPGKVQHEPSDGGDNTTPPPTPVTAPATESHDQPKTALPPAVAQAPDVPKSQNTSDLEKNLAPMMDLISGGKAVGSANVGRLQAGQPLQSDELIHVLNLGGLNRYYGTGMMLSLMKNVSQEMTQYFPGQTVLVGEIAQKAGGNIGHASHQNGLDIDIPYIGTRGFYTMVTPQGHVKDELQFAKTWQFLRLVHGQSIMMNQKEQTVMGMVFMVKPIKAGFCAWAKSNGLLKNKEDADILRRIYPWPKHDNHFHLRLKCSPHYPACRNLPEPGPGTGC